MNVNDFREPYRAYLQAIQAHHMSTSEHHTAKAALETQLVVDQLASAKAGQDAAKTAAASLNCATWVLAAATIVLVIVTVVNIFVH